ncbi:MAG: flagellar motor switch protein FliG [Phycisphaerales bacterium]|nr:MAG: flagellar motor switch protein FliG [Phycisphaerales bacterium]
MAEEPASAPSSSEGQATKGMTKAAILLLALDSACSAAVMRQLDPETIEELTREIAQLDIVTAELRGKVMEEFYNLALANQYMSQGGIAYARSLLEKVLSPEQAARVLRTVESQVYKRPFSFLARTDADNLLTFIQDEHPQTIALILSHLNANKGADILAGLAPPKQLEVVTRIAHMDNTNPEVIREVEQGLELRLSGVLRQTYQEVGGVESVAEMLNLADRSTEKAIIEGLEAQDPDLVEQIRRLMFIFEDILLVNDKGIQMVLKEIENEDLALSLKTASPELREKIFSNMSERASELIKEDMEYMGPVRVSDVEAAQQKIVDVVRRLEDAGELIISGRGGEKEMIV